MIIPILCVWILESRLHSYVLPDSPFYMHTSFQGKRQELSSLSAGSSDWRPFKGPHLRSLSRDLEAAHLKFSPIYRDDTPSRCPEHFPSSLLISECATFIGSSLPAATAPLWPPAPTAAFSSTSSKESTTRKNALVQVYRLMFRSSVFRIRAMS